MLILLPPSETKRSGGSGRALDLDGLVFPTLRDSPPGVSNWYIWPRDTRSPQSMWHLAASGLENEWIRGPSLLPRPGGSVMLVHKSNPTPLP